MLSLTFIRPFSSRLTVAGLIPIRFAKAAWDSFSRARSSLMVIHVTSVRSFRMSPLPFPVSGKRTGKNDFPSWILNCFFPYHNNTIDLLFSQEKTATPPPGCV
jgi:hypothetical protein